MKLIEITEEQYDEICNSGDTYFANGVLFKLEMDNVIAFPWYQDAYSKLIKWFEVVEA